MSDRTIRSFIAVDVADQALTKIIDLQKMLDDTGANIKLVESENIHITLRFLGEISSGLAHNIGIELNNLHFNHFEASLRKVGVFPNMRRINVVWLGIDKGLLELVDIHSQIRVILKRLGVRPDNRPFSPHITIARVRSSRNRDKLSKVIFAKRDDFFGAFRIDSVKLKKSELTPKGPIYTTLKEIKANT